MRQTDKRRVAFALGQVVIVPGIEWMIVEEGRGLPTEDFLRRHSRGDWGVVSEEEIAMNDEAAGQGRPVTSMYELPEKGRLLIITTEPDKATTYVYMAEED